MKLLAAVLLLATLACAQATPKPPAPPLIPAESQLAIFDLQLQITSITDQQKDLVAKYNALNGQIAGLQVKLNEQLDKIYKNAGVSKDKYQVQPESSKDGLRKLVFAPKPEPAKTPPPKSTK